MDSILNFVQLRENIGTSGQPRAEQFRLIADAGYAFVINLAMPDHELSISNEGELVTGTGMTYIHIPVPFDAPLPDHVRHFCHLMKILEGTRVYVHCIMNYRVSAFMYHYLNKVIGCSEEESKSPIFNKWKPDSVWSKLLTWSSKDIGL